MRRSPFYAYPTFPRTFYAPPAEEPAYFHGPRGPFPPSSPTPAPTAPTPRSVINIPVFDSAPSCPSSLPPQQRPITPPPSSPGASPAVPLIDPSSAATTIQSYFRGFHVRRRLPLLHLRSIAKARKQLEELQSEFQSPGFPLKVRASEKERLRFSESVMAIILRLDAIEGSMAVVRSQRKEATKMAIKLQDAIDAIMMQRDEINEIKLTDGPLSDGAKAPDEDSVLCHQSEEPLWPDVNMVQGEVRTGSEEGIMDVNRMQEESTSLEDDVAEKCMSNVDNEDMVAVKCMSNVDNEDMVEEIVPPSFPIKEEDVVEIMDVNPMQEESMPPEHDVAEKCMSNVDIEDMVDEIVPPSFPIKEEDVGQHAETGEHLMSNLGCSESAPQAKLVEIMNDAEQDITHVTEENEGGDATHGAEVEVSNGIDALHFVAPNNHVAKVDQDTFVDDMNAANHGHAQEASSDQLCACMDVEVKGSLSQDVELSPGTPIAEEKCNYPSYGHTAHLNRLQGPSTLLEKLTDDNCSLDDKGSPTLHRHEHENCSDVSCENPIGVTNSCNEAKAQSSALSMLETTSPPDSAVLLQLSEDCNQLRSLVGKLFAQNKAQSKVLCALGERLELLEHQQHLNCQQQTREKRKLRKGSKRSVKCRNCE